MYHHQTGILIHHASLTCIHPPADSGWHHFGDPALLLSGLPGGGARPTASHGDHNANRDSDSYFNGLAIPDRDLDALRNAQQYPFPYPYRNPYSHPDVHAISDGHAFAHQYPASDGHAFAHQYPASDGHALAHQYPASDGHALAHQYPTSDGYAVPDEHPFGYGYAVLHTDLHRNATLTLITAALVRFQGGNAVLAQGGEHHRDHHDHSQNDHDYGIHAVLTRGSDIGFFLPRLGHAFILSHRVAGRVAALLRVPQWPAAWSDRHRRPSPGRHPP